jgi:hypothetical protein
MNDPEDPYSLSGDNINSLFEDHEGILWVGTGGVVPGELGSTDLNEIQNISTS